MDASGTAIGPFHIERELGRGGMGVVYLARDARLDRAVAIKSLPEQLLEDPDRMARFEREAKTLAALNHPNIAGIHGVEVQHGHRFLILEFVDGPTLADRLENGPIPLDDALDIAEQIAAGLEAAHDAGIVHRDLKPGNIKIAPNGKVKILDFGLAKSTEGSASSSSMQTVQTQSPTVSVHPIHSPTIPGAIMGTAPYMSPEQARGKAVDKRSDIWSFGVVLYEMLTGINPFHGETATDSIGAILHRDVDLSALPRETPISVRHVITRCLQRDKSLRYHDIADAALDLRDTTRSDASASPRRPAERTRALAVAALTLMAFAAAGGWLIANRKPSRATMPIVRFEINQPEGHVAPSFGEGFPPLCVSPTGDTIVFGASSDGKMQLYVRDMNTLEPRPLAGTAGASVPFFSPDGRWLAFFVGDRLMKMPIAGGPPVPICEAPRSPAVWLEDGTIVFGNYRRVMRVSAEGGTPSVVASTDAQPRLPDGTTLVLGFNRVAEVPGADYVLASVWTGDTIDDYMIIAVSLRDGSIRPVIRNATDARMCGPDHVVFLRGSSLMAVPFDRARGEATSDPLTVIDSVLTSRWADAGVWATSASGTLIYVPGGRIGPDRRLVRVDASGVTTPIMDGVDAIVGGPRVSPDGRYTTMVTLRRRVELWVYDLERRSMSLVTAQGETWNPIWTPDSTALIFTRIIPGRPHEVVRKSISVSPEVPAEPIGITTQGEFYPASITPDGTTLFLMKSAGADDLKERIALFHLGAGNADVEPVPGAGADVSQPHISPDGKTLAYISNESGDWNVYLRTLGPSGSRVQVSSSSGSDPRWSPDGNHLYFLDRSNVVHAVDVDTSASLRVSAPKPLFDTRKVATMSLWGSFDVLPDGSFIMVAPAEWETRPSRFRVVLNWDQELAEKLPARRR